MRFAELLPYFTSGVQYPAVLVRTAAALKTGDAGIACARFFGEDWSVSKRDFAFAGVIGRSLPSPKAPNREEKPHPFW